MKIETILLATILCFKINVCQCQIWPVTPMVRFGNTSYYDIDSLIANKFKMNRHLLGKTLTQSFIDTKLKEGILTLNLNDERVTFTQKNYNTIQNNSSRLFYARRPLTSYKDQKLYTKIDYIKVIGTSTEWIDVEVQLKKRDFSGRLIKQKIKSKISNKDIEGLFVGPGKKYRLWTTILATSATLTFIILGNQN